MNEIETGKGADAIERRPVLAAALAAARRAHYPVIVAKLDRLSRDVHFISGLMVHKVPFIDAGDDRRQHLRETLRPLLHRGAAQPPRLLRVRPVAEQRTPLLFRGQRLARPLADPAPLHLGEGGVEVERERVGVGPELGDVASGIGTDAGIAEALNARGVATARGGRWHAQTVKNVRARAARLAGEEPCG
jgi:hypothetical protein